MSKILDEHDFAHVGDKTGTIRRYLRLADTMLSDRDDDPSTAA